MCDYHLLALALSEELFSGFTETKTKKQNKIKEVTVIVVGLEVLYFINMQILRDSDLP